MHDGKGLRARPGIGQADRFHGTEEEGLEAAPGHDLYRQAALEEPDILEVVQRNLSAALKRFVKAFEFGLRHGAVEVIPFAVVVARSPEDLHEIDRLGKDDGGNGVVERQVGSPGSLREFRGQGVGGQGTAGENNGPVIEQRGRLFADQFKALRGRESGLDVFGEQDAVNGQGPACGNGGRIRCLHDERSEQAQLRFEEPHGTGRIVGTQRIAADELGQERRAVGGREPRGFHLVEGNGDVAAKQLPGRLTAGQPAADDDDRLMQRRSFGLNRV